MFLKSHNTTPSLKIAKISYYYFDRFFFFMKVSNLKIITIETPGIEFVILDNTFNWGRPFLT